MLFDVAYIYSKRLGAMEDDYHGEDSDGDDNQESDKTRK